MTRWRRGSISPNSSCSRTQVRRRSADARGVNASLTTTSGTPARRRSGPQSYDFRRPNKVSREHLRALQIVNETFARQFSNVLASTLRAVSQVTLTSVDQLTYDEYL